MNGWNKQTINVKGFPVTVYVNADRTMAVLFFLFGRYARLSCYNAEQDALDFVVDFLLGNSNNVINAKNYVNSFEDTAIIAA